MVSTLKNVKSPSESIVLSMLAKLINCAGPESTVMSMSAVKLLGLAKSKTN